MKYFVIIVLLVSQFSAIAQTREEKIDKLLHRKAELERSLLYYQKELKEVNAKIQQLKQVSTTPVFVSESGDKIVATVGSKATSLHTQPNTQSPVIITVPANTTIYIHKEHKGLYFKATYYGKEGWVNYTSLQPQADIDALVQKSVSSTTGVKTTTTKVIVMDETNPKFKRLSKIYGAEKAVKIINKDLWKGMSHGQVKESLGKATSVTTANTDKGLKEEWVYPNRKLTFLNGTLLSW